MDVVSPHNTVVHTPFHMLEGTGNGAVPLVETIPTDHVSLRCDLVVEPPERGVEGGIVAMGRVEWDGVITFPCIVYTFLPAG